MGDSKQFMSPVPQLGPIWATNINGWFYYIENEFIIQGIVDQRIMFQATLRSLNSQLCEEVTPEMANAATPNPYDLLKSALLKRLALTDRQRADELFREIELGSTKPTQLLRRMRQLLNGQQLEERLLRQLFLQRLPAQAQTALAACRSASLEELAETADAVLEAIGLPINSINTHSMPSATPVAGPSTQFVPMDAFEKLIHELNAIKLELRQRSRSRSTSRQRSRNRRNSGSRRRQSSNTRRHPTWCWYHDTWGPKANTCVQPCTYNKDMASGN